MASELEDQRMLKIQVAYVLNFGKFIKWPTHKTGQQGHSFVIGVYGANPFGGLLDGLEGKTVQGHVVQTRIFKSVHQTDDCQILFVGAMTRRHELLELLDYLAPSRLYLGLSAVAV